MSHYLSSKVVPLGFMVLRLCPIVALVVSIPVSQGGENPVALKGHTDQVSALAFSPDGKLLATGSFDKTIRLWDSATGKERAILQGHTQDVTSIAFSPDGKVLASGSRDKTVVLWDVTTAKPLSVLQGDTHQVEAVAFSPNGKLLAVGGTDKVIRLWDRANGKVWTTLAGHESHVQALAFSPDGKMLASGSDDDTVRLWALGTGKVSRTLQLSAVGCATFSPDGKLLAAASRTGLNEARLWDPFTGVRTAVKGHARWVNSVAFSPDGCLLATGGDDGGVRLSDVETRKEVAVLEGRRGIVVALAFNPGKAPWTATSYMVAVATMNNAPGWPGGCDSSVAHLWTVPKPKREN